MKALLLLLLCLAVPALAQGGSTKPGARDGKPVFSDPEEEPAQEDPKVDPGAENDDPLRAQLERLKGWPSDASRRAAERLIVQKERTREEVYQILLSTRKEDQALKPGAAYALGHIGEPGQALALILAASEREQRRHAAVFLEAAYRLDAELAVEEVFRFFAMSQTTIRREAVVFVRERVTARNLGQVLDLLDHLKSPQGFTREIGLTLLDRLVATGQVTREQASPHFYAALGDASPSVARSAMLLLASRNEPDNIAELNRRVSGEVADWRRRSYAAMALALLSTTFRVEALTPESLVTLRGESGLLHRKEMFARAAAALALAQAALRSNDPALTRLLDREIPIVLIDSVGGSGRHYLDFASVQPLAYSMLRRITGETFPDQAPLWAVWWKDHGERFRARRELTAVEEVDLSEAVVDLAPPGADPVRFTAVAGSPPTFRMGRAYALPKRDLLALVELLEEAEFFRRGEADPALSAGEAIRVTVRVASLSRSVDFGMEEGQRAVREKLLAETARLVGEFGWQRWWDMGAQPSWPVFFSEQARWFADNREPAQRADRMRAMIAAALKDLIAVEDRVAAVAAIEALEGGGGALTPEQAQAFVRAVAVETEANEFVEAAVVLLVPAAGEAAVAGLVEALSDKIGPGAHTLLVRLGASLEGARLEALASDERWKVRRAAVTALAARDAAAARPVLIASLKDEETLVRLAAIEALARAKDPAVLKALPQLAADPSPSVRAAAAYSYGLLGGQEAQGALAPLLYSDPEVDVRVRAIEGLAESRDPRVADALVRVFENETDLRVRTAAANALVGIETPELVEALIQRLQLTRAESGERVALVNVLARFKSPSAEGPLRAALNGDDTASADAAALGLARRWDGGALGQLIAMLRRGRNARSALLHLQLLSSRAFAGEGFEEQARNYESWVAANGDGDPRIWFRDVLAERGHDTAPLATFAAGDALKESAIPLLLRVLRESEWYLVRNASMLLSERMGPGAPEILDHLTMEEDKEKAIRAYHAWWAKESEKSKAAERG
ncbi:MAG: HEAT repeat domain-containing protein [Planctomycetaceae bacterium]